MLSLLKRKEVYGTILILLITFIIYRLVNKFINRINEYFFEIEN